jgi:hypothetical protein
MLCVAIAALRRFGERITSIEQAMSLNGVGEKTAQKVMGAGAFLAQLAFPDFITRSWKLSKLVPYGASMPRERKMSRLSRFSREYTALVGSDRFALDSPLFIRPSRAINRVCLVPCWLPHARRHQAKKGRHWTFSCPSNRVEVL